jgi:hypothetical protein
VEYFLQMHIIILHASTISSSATSVCGKCSLSCSRRIYRTGTSQVTTSQLDSVSIISPWYACQMVLASVRHDCTVHGRPGLLLFGSIQNKSGTHFLYLSLLNLTIGMLAWTLVVKIATSQGYIWDLLSGSPSMAGISAQSTRIGERGNRGLKVWRLGISLLKAEERTLVFDQLVISLFDGAFTFIRRVFVMTLNLDGKEDCEQNRASIHMTCKG